MGRFLLTKDQMVNSINQLLEVNKITVEKYEEAMENMEFSVALSVPFGN